MNNKSKSIRLRFLVFLVLCGTLGTIGLSEFQNPPPVFADGPRITDVEVTTSPARDNTYGVGETIEVTATFSTDVEVDGNPGLGLNIGGTWRAAYYERGSGTDELVFSYKVKPEDSDSNGISMDGGYQDSNGTWHNFLSHTAVTGKSSGATASRTYDGIGNQSGHKVDGDKLPNCDKCLDRLFPALRRHLPVTVTGSTLP